MGLNKSIIMGRLTADPELRKTQNGKSVTSFTVAVDNGKDTAASFIDCVAWDAVADFLAKYWHKGKMIAVEGRLQTRTYEDKNGSKHKPTEIIAERVFFCGDKDGIEGGDRGVQTAYGATIGFVDADPDGELPF